MSLFRKAGEKFEETKQAFMEGKDEAYQCQACGERFGEEHEFCPECGEETVELTE